MAAADTGFTVATVRRSGQRRSTIGRTTLTGRSLLLLLLLIVVVIIGDCPVGSSSLPRRLEEIVEGGQLTLRCYEVDDRASYEDLQRLEWRKNGAVIASYSQRDGTRQFWVVDPRFSLNLTFFSLTIDPIKPADRGYYKCGPRFRLLPNWIRDLRLLPEEIKLRVIAKPSKPGRPIVSRQTSHQALISWEASLTRSDAPIVRYHINIYTGEVDVALDPIRRVRTTNNSTSWWVEGLEPFTVYRFDVQGENYVGKGQPGPTSYPIRTHGEAFTTPPKLLTVENVTDTTITINWTHPDDFLKYIRVLKYRLTIRSIKTAHTEWYYVKANVTTYQFVNLTAYTKYEIVVEPDNGFGKSPSASLLVTTDEQIPSASPLITQLSAVSSRSVELSIASPNVTQGFITHYTLYWRVFKGDSFNKKRLSNGLYVQMLRSNVSEYRLESLEPFTKYLIWITASTSRGEGPSSQVFEITTDTAAPSQPTLNNITTDGDSSVLIEWLPPARIHSRVDFYIITISDDEKKWQLNTTKTSIHLRNLRTNVRYAATVRAATRSIVTEKLRYYVGVESATEGFILPDSSDRDELHQVILRTSICPIKNIYRIDFQLRKSIYCDRMIQKFTMNTTVSTLSVEQMEADQQKYTVPVAAIAVLGTLGLLGLLISLVLVALHFWRRHFSAKNWLPYSSDGNESGFRGYQSDEDFFEKCEENAIPVDRYAEHVRSLHADSDAGFAREYESLATGNMDNIESLCKHSLLNENKPKNRYVNILPYDRYRVHLQPTKEGKNSDYINASYVDGFRQRNAYIATQGPLPNTIVDFWRMVWETRCSVIVMITNIIERGRKKCDQYWPNEGEETYGSFAVSLLNERSTAFYIVRTMMLRNLKKRQKETHRLIVQYHCTCWPDHGIPENPSVILNFIRKSSAANRNSTAPIIVHCSAGVGRSGTYIVIDVMLRQMKVLESVDVLGFLKKIRQQRMYLVQTEEQYVFCYDALLEALNAGETEMHHFQICHSVSDWLSGDSNVSVRKKQFDLVLSAKTNPFTEATKSYNMDKNRDHAPAPVDDHRVIISAIPGELGSDYINASFLPGFHRSDEFVVTQFPLDQTVTSFWRMLYDHNCPMIVVLTDVHLPNFKQFWPEKVGQVVKFNNLSVNVNEQIEGDKFSCYEICIQSSEDEYQQRSRLLHCSSWSSLSVEQMWDFIRVAQEKHLAFQGGPTVVVDRLGGKDAAIFCLLSALSCQFEQDAIVDVYTLVRCFQARRPGMLPVLADYLQIFDCLHPLLMETNNNGEISSYKAQTRSLPPSAFSSLRRSSSIAGRGSRLDRTL